nr:uncharacterized protein LOC112028662 [Quercus suber]
MDPVEHVSHYSQRMTVHAKDEALMCKVFPSSLGPVAMKWFNGLRVNSIGSFEKLTQVFGARFITCRRVSQPLGSLLSMSMRKGETLKAYSDRYWEMFNEVDGAYDDVAINTFTAGLPTEHDFRKSLTGKPVTSVRQLMDQIDKYRRVEANPSTSARGVECENLERVSVEDDPDKFFQVEAQLLMAEKEQLVEVLRKNIDVFAWNAYEAPGWIQISFVII